MYQELKFLREFPTERNGMYIVYEPYTFDNLFRLFLKSGFDCEEALDFILANCSLSAVVFQERIHNSRYRKLFSCEALPAKEAACKAKSISDCMEVAGLLN
jgi:hypothetical protein